MIAGQKLRFGMVGAGAIAQSYVQAFKSSEKGKLVAVADSRREAADGIAGTMNCQSFSSHKEMADACELDAVIVSTPPVTHPDICIELMARGLNVLCEKPLAIDSASARRMLDQAERSKVKFTMASKFRYVDDVVRAKSIVASGILGDLILFENTFTACVDMSNRWNSDPKVSGGGVLMDNGTHSVDIMRYFLGPLADLQVVEGKRVQSLPVEDTVKVFVRSETGVMGNIDLSWSINKALPTYLSIHGSSGTLHVGWKESKYHRSSDTEWVVFGKGYDKVQAFRSQIDNFAGAIQGTEALVITPADALASVQAVEAAYEALRRSVWQPLRTSGNGESAKHAATASVGSAS